MQRHIFSQHVTVPDLVDRSKYEDKESWTRSEEEEEEVRIEEEERENVDEVELDGSEPDGDTFEDENMVDDGDHMDQENEEKGSGHSMAASNDEEVYPASSDTRKDTQAANHAQ